MRIVSELTDATIAQMLGERIERYRIGAGLTQAELAERASIGKRTVERVEAGGGGELITLIRVLRALNALEGFERLLPELPPSPIELLKLRGKQRQRVSHLRGRSEPPERRNHAQQSHGPGVGRLPTARRPQRARAAPNTPGGRAPALHDSPLRSYERRRQDSHAGARRARAAQRRKTTISIELLELISNHLSGQR